MEKEGAALLGLELKVSDGILSFSDGGSKPFPFPDDDEFGMWSGPAALHVKGEMTIDILFARVWLFGDVSSSGGLTFGVTEGRTNYWVAVVNGSAGMLAQVVGGEMLQSVKVPLSCPDQLIDVYVSPTMEEDGFQANMTCVSASVLMKLPFLDDGDGDGGGEGEAGVPVGEAGLISRGCGFTVFQGHATRTVPPGFASVPLSWMAFTDNPLVNHLAGYFFIAFILHLLNIAAVLFLVWHGRNVVVAKRLAMYGAPATIMLFSLMPSFMRVSLVLAGTLQTGFVFGVLMLFLCIGAGLLLAMYWGCRTNHPISRPSLQLMPDGSEPPLPRPLQKTWIDTEDRNTSYPARLGRPFSHIKFGKRWFAVVELWKMMAIMLVLAVPGLGCDPRPLYVAIVLLAYLLAQLIVRPYLAGGDQILRTMCTAAEVGIYGSYYLTLKSEGNPTWNQIRSAMTMLFFVFALLVLLFRLIKFSVKTLKSRPILKADPIPSPDDSSASSSSSSSSSSILCSLFGLPRHLCSGSLLKPPQPVAEQEMETIPVDSGGDGPCSNPEWWTKWREDTGWGPFPHSAGLLPLPPWWRKWKAHKSCYWSPFTRREAEIEQKLELDLVEEKEKEQEQEQEQEQQEPPDAVIK